MRSTGNIYYTDVRRPLAFAILLACILAGCDRGTRPPQIGKLAPDFVVQDSDRRIALHDLRGKTVVLNFWATWCPPCIVEMPSLVALQSRVGGDIVILGVNEQDQEEAYRKFLKDYNINFMTVHDTAGANTKYGTTGFPETFIIDPDGVLRRKFVGPVDWVNPEILDYLSKLPRTRTQTALN